MFITLSSRSCFTRLRTVPSETPSLSAIVENGRRPSSCSREMMFQLSCASSPRPSGAGAGAGGRFFFVSFMRPRLPQRSSERRGERVGAKLDGREMRNRQVMAHDITNFVTYDDKNVDFVNCNA
jgi:hypothetical protein